MNFESQIKQLVQLNNQLKEVNERARELREKRNVLEQNLTNNASSNSIIQIPDGKLKFVNTNVPEPLTFKYLEKSLLEIIKLYINYLYERIRLYWIR